MSMTIREHAEQLGYIYNCFGCGRKSDTPNCGCMPDEEPEPAEQLEGCPVCGSTTITEAPDDELVLVCGNGHKLED